MFICGQEASIFIFFSKNLDFVWGVDRVRSRRELKDKIFAKLRKTNVKIIAKNAKNRKEKRYFLKNIKTNDFGNAKLI
jgi:hypothetical protein